MSKRIKKTKITSAQLRAFEKQAGEEAEKEMLSSDREGDDYSEEHTRLYYVIYNFLVKRLTDELADLDRLDPNE